MADEQEERAVVICGRVGKLRPDSVVRGAIRIQCSKGCGYEVWMAPASVKLGDPVCMTCLGIDEDNIVESAMKFIRDKDVQPLTEEQKQEVAEHLQRENKARGA